MEIPQWGSKYQQSGAADASEPTSNGKTGDVVVVAIDESAPDADPDESQGPIISEKAKQLITQILEQLKEFSNAEKYLLNLKLYQASNVMDPLRQPLNPLGSRAEINRTISWIKTHLEEDPDTSLPKQQVYEEYSGYCFQSQMKCLSQADFGKVMKQVYPKVRPRRLGTRGNSRYCYSGLKRCLQLSTPKLPDLADKPLSTEAPFSSSNLTAAAWLIVKEWFEIQFEVQFPSLQGLARYLVINHSVGVGTDAANQLTLATESQLKGGDLSGMKSGTKHRMQLQLQKKIQLKNEVKERKRKMQSPKNEPKPAVKKSKSLTICLDGSPVTTGCGESSTSTSTGSTSTSPTQGKPNCDKSIDFTHLPALPDFKSFQKPPLCEQTHPPAPPPPPPQNGLGGSLVLGATTVGAATTTTTTKIAIPRMKTTVAPQRSSPQASPKKHVRSNIKYKAIQPKPQQCDNASYNPQTKSAVIRSHDVLNVDRFKDRKCHDDGCETAAFPLTRERLESISNVDKDAMDEYLGTNNSQHEEELSKYFSNNVDAAFEHDNHTKLSQLRQLLEQNGIADSKSFPLIDSAAAFDTPPIDALPLQAIPPVPYIVPQPPNTRRRVSFETPEETTVPPSPNTRRKNFSFTPISPGPQSPNGRLSKSSSTNVSPFVSPRNTPVPRSKNSTHQNAGIGVRRKIKRELDLTIEVQDTGKTRAYLAMSAPASPMLFNNNKSVLEKLLHSNSKVAYTPDYNSVVMKASEGAVVEDESGGPAESFTDFSYRSQSVPLNQMAKSNYGDDPQFLQPLSTQAAAAASNDFNDFDHISETETVNGIIEALDEQQCESSAQLSLYNVDLSAANAQCFQNFNLIVDSNIDSQYTDDDFAPQGRTLGRSQSIDVGGCYDMKSNHPSRSVPSTPLSFTQNLSKALKSLSSGNSRSYPSTPLLVSNTFNYNGDCLLNGQPIRTNGGQDLSSYLIGLNEVGGGGDGTGGIEKHLVDEEFIINRNLQSSDFGIVDSENGLMDENGVLIEEQGYNGNVN